MPKGAKYGGRVAGTPNKATAEVKEIAREFGPSAINKLAALAGLVHGVKAASAEATQVAALREILDRGYGRAVQPVGGEPDEPIIVNIVRFADMPDDGDDPAEVQPMRPSI